MKFLVALFSFFSIYCNAQLSPQTLEQLTNSMALLQKGEYEKVIPIAEKAMTALKREVGEKNEMYQGMFFILGICHYNLYHYQEAERYYLQHKDILARSSGVKDKTYLAAVSRLAVLYRAMGKYQQSINLFREVQVTSKEILGENSEEYSKSINNLALLYSDVGEFAKAEQLYLESGAILKKLSGENTANYASSVNNLGTLYSSMGQYEKALSYLKRVLIIRKQVLGETNSDYGETLNNIASVYLSLSNYAESEKYYKEATAIFKKSLGEESPYYAVGINNLAYYYQVVAKYDKAEELYKEAIRIRKKLLGEEHPDYASSLSNLAAVYLYAGNYDNAESLYLRSAEIKRKSLGLQHPDYAVSINNLAGLYESMGQYSKSEPLYQQALAIKEKIYGRQHPDYAIGLNNLAFLYYNLGQYEKTEPLFVRAAEIIKASIGEINPSYATSLNNLANVWQSMKQYDKAEKAYLKVIDIYRSLFGVAHNDYALGLNNLATLYAEMGLYAKAEPYLIEAKETWKKALGANSPAYATGLNNLAAFYRKTQSQYAKSEALYLEAIQLRKNILGVQHPYYSESQNDLGLLYTQMGQYKKAEPLFLSSSTILLRNIAGTFSILSEKEKGKYLNYNRQLVECNNSYLYQLGAAPSSVIENNYNLELAIKSLSLADTRNLLDQVRQTSDTQVIRKFNEWLAAKTLLAKEYAIPAANRVADLRAIETNAELMEKELNKLSASFTRQQKSVRITMKDVQKNLGADEAAVEFIRFNFYRNGWTDSVLYGAFVVRKNDTAPHFVMLCEKKQLDTIFLNAGNSTTKQVKSFYRGLGSSSSEVKSGAGLYQLIWQPLEPYLNGIKKIAYSPAGKLYSIAFHALPVDSNSILMDKYQLEQYTSTRQIALRDLKTADKETLTIVLVGNPQFTMDSLQLVQQARTKANGNSFVTRSGNSSTGVWIDLPGTAEEVKTISEIFSTNSYRARSFTGASASEDNIKSFSGSSPRILHIATHGFFLPPVKKAKSNIEGGNTYSLSDDPLLRSGIVLAGGNYAWSGKKPVDGVDDGILTAYEISQLNLSSTELLVLSACETGLGDIKGTEGVFGLQRGFKIAGVKKMIVSLWQVPDKETAELMVSFYGHFLKGKSINEAFYLAQGEMRKKYAAYYWAAFVLIE